MSAPDGKDRVIQAGPTATDVIENLAVVAEAKQELARQLYFRLVRMGVAAGLFRIDEQVEFEYGVRTIDKYLGIDPGPERTQ